MPRETKRLIAELERALNEELGHLETPLEKALALAAAFREAEPTVKWEISFDDGYISVRKKV